MTELGRPIATWSGSTRAGSPLVVLFHGWGEDETVMTALARSLPADVAYASLRAPYRLGGHHGWFASGFPFEQTVKWFEDWLDGVTWAERPVVLVGFSAGAAFAGGAILMNPARYLGAAMLCGTLPFDAGLSPLPGRLTGKHVFVGHSRDDPQMPHDVLDRAWDYLTKDSGAVTRAVKYDGGHEITPKAAADLNGWLGALTTS